MFLICYSVARIAVEFVREPDVQIGYLAGGAALGWLLSLGTSRGRRIAIVLPTAMRDFAVAAGIATSAFGAAAAAPLGIYGLLVLVFGTAAVAAQARAASGRSGPER